jgi:hypothetical protein
MNSPVSQTCNVLYLWTSKNNQPGPRRQVLRKTETDNNQQRPRAKEGKWTDKNGTPHRNEPRETHGGDIASINNHHIPSVLTSGVSQAGPSLLLDIVIQMQKVNSVLPPCSVKAFQVPIHSICHIFGYLCHHKPIDITPAYTSKHQTQTKWKKKDTAVIHTHSMEISSPSRPSVSSGSGWCFHPLCIPAPDLAWTVCIWQRLVPVPSCS